MINDDTGIAYGVSLAVVAVIVLGVTWISASPLVDEFNTLIADLHADDPATYTDQLVEKTTECTNIWQYITFLFVAVPVVFAIVRAIRRQAFD
jgi:preprotein translocase subunit SecY